MTRAIAYIRLDAKGTDVAPHRQVIERWAEREAVDIASWQIDDGIGSATPIAERPALLSAYAELRPKSARLLVAASAEQFAKDELVAWLIERAALTEGATLQTADGSRLAPQPDASFTRGAINIARAYRRVVSGARIRASLAEKRARGERIGNVPYGYRLAADGVHIEPHPAEQTVVATVRELSAGGLSQRAIATQLTERGVTGRTGAPLGQTQVASILRGSRTMAQ